MEPAERRRGVARAKTRQGRCRRRPTFDAGASEVAQEPSGPNDEAHRVHDEGLHWSQSLLAVDRVLPNGLAAWLDFSLRPKDQSGMYFPWVVCDYPLAQAVEDRNYQAPLIV